MKYNYNNLNNMKKAIIYSAMALASLTMTSCGDSFLLIDPAGSVSEATLTTESGIDMVLTGAYSSFNSMTQTAWMGYGSLFNFVYGDVVGGDANKGSTAGDQPDWTQLETFTFSASNGYISGKWNSVYEAVKRANNVLKMAEDMGDALPNKSVIEAQAKFIKAVWMFEGIKMFGAAIPYITLEDYKANTDPQVGNIDESGSYIYVWDKVEADLKEAIAGLPADWNSTGEYGRATSWMAKAVLAKMYMYWASPYNGNMSSNPAKMSEAKSILKDIIDNGVDAKGQKYKLIDHYGDLYNANSPDCDWGGEGVFDVQLTISGTQTDTNAIASNPAIGQAGASGLGGWGFYQPSYDFANSFIVDANGLPLSTADYRAQPRLTQMVTTAAGDVPQTDLTVYVDPRIDFTMGRFNVPFLDYGTPTALNGWVRDPNNAGLYMNKKNLPYISDRGSTSVSTAPASSAKNYHVIRFADILLLYAECLINDGDLSGALDYINQVRARAANDFVKADATTVGTYSLDDKVNGKTVAGAAGNYRVGLYTAFASKDEAITALRAERRAELGMEGHRWFDLARWGVAADVLNDYVTYEGAFFPNKYSNYGKNWVMFPIPYNQIVTAMGRFKQNADWE